MADEPESPTTRSPSARQPVEVSIQADYANRVVIQMTSTDVKLIFTVGNIPRRIMMLPLGTAKGLAAALSDVIRGFEKDMGIVIPTDKELDEKIRRINATKKPAAKAE